MQAVWVVLTLCAHVFGAPYDASEVDYNLNQNQTATHPLEYYGEWSNHTYNKSPSNWRFPFYTLFLDRLANGDPSNDNANGTLYEQDILSNQFRHGGDVAGMLDSLDYLQGMGIKGLYIAGSPFINQPWTADSYSPLDLTVLDHHFGTIDTWRTVINAIHARGMYIVLDNTFATMGDLVGFEGYLNTTTPFDLAEHKTSWKSQRRYLDFEISNQYNATCSYPRFWNETGYRINSVYTDKMKGCYNSEFDQYGDTEAFGVYPDFQRQLTKFASVQDRLRDWHPPVLEKINHFSCIVIKMLDIDGFRFDKATQITVDAQAGFGKHMRDCARSVGKENFFMPGEITGGNTFGSIYLGRGRQPDMLPANATVATQLTNNSDHKYFIRDQGMGALDAAAFHYTIYRSLTRFLGMDGNLEAGYDANGGSWTAAWNTMLLSNDFVNENSGVFDPRHMFGVTNQDVFRWPAISQGVERMILGMFVTAIHLPGIPLVTFGEEQAFYVLDSTADNYIYGRQPMTSAIAWQMHGCYSLGSSQYYQMPLNDSRNGCKDDTVSYDHRDPSHPVRNILKHMYYLRDQFPVLNDGWYLQDLSNQTHAVVLPGSSGKPTETGIWSVVRKEFTGSQTLSSNQSIWFVYHNVNETTSYTFDCTSKKNSFLSAFEKDTTAKNLFYPFDEITLGSTTTTTSNTGCVSNITMKPYEFKVYVPKEKFVSPPPMITKFLPGHDARLKSSVSPGQQETVDVEIQFSAAMSCDAVTKAIMLNSTAEDLRVARVKSGSVQCSALKSNTSKYVGDLPSAWTWKATLENVSNGIHAITVKNATQTDGTATNSVDRFMFRTGQDDNPMVFPKTANYTRALIHANGSDTDLYISHKAAGADKWRYSLTWGSSWSDWEDYYGGNSTLKQQHWTGTALQKWEGTHIMAQYWSRLTGSSAVIQHADLGREGKPPRRVPHLFVQGPYNQYGYDAGLSNQASLTGDGVWDWHFMSEWPDTVQLNVWGMNPDGQPDASFVYGDIDADGILDRLPPSSLSNLAINVTRGPPTPWLAWKLSIDDGTFRYILLPVGNRWLQLMVFMLMAFIPLITACLVVFGYMQGFYEVKFNEVGVSKKHGFMALPLALRRGRGMKKLAQFASSDNLTSMDPAIPFSTAVAGLSEKRRTVLIATLEYDIDDWNVKIKIGGLGVMAQLMGKNLEHQDLIWVVPCVGGVDYPPATPAEPMEVIILGEKYDVQVQVHQLRNITYVLLDAPIFRAQSKTEPYPPRMDDLDSAVYYSAWNQCIARAIQRYPVDLYHINDYHGACAPLYLLPETIPCCLSLHNAEFQGLWPMRTPKERAEVCSVFNLSEKTVAQYVQFGSVFNLLHAGASYLRVHQKGVGAVGVSNKYGKRSWARYPIFWGLKAIGKLPNPDPTDTEAWDKQLPKEGDIHVDPAYEASRGELKRQAQEWAGLEQRADAELFVFVGRWSVQKGVDLIADVFPAVLEHHERVQLICIGPVIDLYGKFAALKLGKMMEKYPGRVFSKPEFTALPPYIFSGAEFALIPSRDEPFGLVAVEFGRKGALGVGARVGGLGQMPGWWYTVESTTSSHLLKQFKESIDIALASSQETRAMMRARSAKQRFPVQQWKEDLGILQTKCIKIHDQEVEKHGGRLTRHHDSGAPVPPIVTLENNELRSVGSPTTATAAVEGPSSGGLKRTLSLGVRQGPGHRSSREGDAHPDNILEDDEYIVEHGYQNGGDLDHPDSLPLPPWPIRYPDNRFSTVSAMSAVSFDPQRASTATEHPSPFPSPAFLRPGREGTESPGYYESDSLVPPSPGFYQQPESNRSSLLSLNLVVGEKKDFKLQKVDPFFTDSNMEYFNAFESKLGDLNGKNSEHELCIEEYLIKSERTWFGRFRDARLGRTHEKSIGESRVPSRSGSPNPSAYRFPNDSYSEEDENENDKTPLRDEFLLGDDYKPPTGMRKYAQMKIGDWPIYTLLLSIGQIISANSYQVTLLTGSVGQAASKLYVVASIYLVASIFWWILFRRVKSVYCLASPFIFYGLAFLILGMAPFVGNGIRGWLQNGATATYAVASASGSLFFAMNFGDEGGAPVKDWIYRACIIQGTQQLYNAALWYWGTTFTATSSSDGATVASSYATFVNSWKMTCITAPVAVLMWIVGYLILVGLPDFYRQAPGAVPSFYSALARRKIVVWTLVTVLIQNFFLSAPYGRNWHFLWSSRAAPKWAVAVLMVFFFVVLWVGILLIFARLSKSHSWIVPLFAIGLGAPRWCQMLWSTSNIGLYLPWAGNAVSSALVSRSLWLWLGLLDTIQGVGFGMIFLQTLTRIHVAFTLIAAQVLGSVATIVARAAAPNKLGPGDVFPDFSQGANHVVTKVWFWLALVFQLIICAGYLTFFRKEQLNKP